MNRFVINLVITQEHGFQIKGANYMGRKPSCKRPAAIDRLVVLLPGKRTSKSYGLPLSMSVNFWGRSK